LRDDFRRRRGQTNLGSGSFDPGPDFYVVLMVVYKIFMPDNKVFIKYG
jgi:hypothetical protein